MNSFIGILMINTVINTFKKLVKKLEKGIELCNKAVKEKETTIINLHSDIASLNKQITDAEAIKNKIKAIID